VAALPATPKPVKRIRPARIIVAATWLIVAAWSADTSAQVPREELPRDTLEVVGRDTVDARPVDLPALDLGGDLVAPAIEPSRGDEKHPVTFAARDSLVIMFAPEDDPEGDIGTLYGDARTEYEEARLSAFEIDLLFHRELLRARGPATDTAVVGRPAFERGSDSFTGRELTYHLATQRGRVVGARTSLQDGYLQGGVVVQAGPRITYAQDVVYTTCEYEDHNHWGLHTHRMKVVDGEWVYTGAARLHILGIPTPIWLPFGFFPALEGRRSGPLPPDYGEQFDLGFYLRNVGYYWAISDYMDLQLAGGMYSSGSYESDASFRYARRYWYDGSLRVGYRVERRGEPQDPNHVTQQQASINWRHSQRLDAAGNTRLVGNIDLRSSGYARNLASDYDQRVNQQTTSNLNLTHRWRNGRNISLSYRQNLNLSDGSTNLTLPQLSYNQPRWFPFRGGAAPGRRWYDQISLQYASTLDNTYRFPAGADTSGVTWLEGLLSADAFHRATGLDERFDTRATHNVPLAAQFSISRLPLLGSLQLDVSPSVAYREQWFSSRRDVQIDGDGWAVRDTLGTLQFERTPAFTAIRQADLTVSASTRMFGTFPWRVGSFDGFRHELRPSVAFRYAPDLSAPFWGRIRQHANPDGTLVEYPVRPEVLAPGRPQQSIDIGVTNVFQTRIAREDATGEVQRRVVSLLNLSLNSGYDLAADSLRWRDVNLNARTSIAEQVSLNLSASYSPYAVNSLGVPEDRLYFSEAGLPLRFTRANFNASTSLRGGQGGRSAEIRAPAHRPPHFQDLEGFGAGGLLPYDYRRSDLGFVDFAVPWSLSLDFNYGLHRNFTGGQDNVHATVNSSFDLGLTPQWRISGRTGYDLDNGQFVPTQISVLRDLHCWEMSFTWLPFGQVQAFAFSIYVKSGHLSDLLRLDVPNVDRTRHF
jgi:hypothetical protein